MTRLLRWLDHLPSWLRSGVVTGTVTAFVTSGAALLAWLEDFFEWAAGEPVAFPDVGALRALAVGIVAGGVFGAANAAFRGAQEWLRRRGHQVGNPPVYPTRAAGDRGQVSPGTAILVLVAVLLVIVVLRGTGTC